MWIVFEKGIEISPLRHMTKEEKGQYVYDYLIERSTKSQGAVIDFLTREQIPFTSFYIVNAILTEKNDGLAGRLMSFPGVKTIEKNAEFRVLDDVSEDALDDHSRNLELPWGLSLIRADQVWQMGITGKDVVIGGHDTGVMWDHPALEENYRGWDGSRADHNYNWHDAIHAISPLHRDSIITDTTNPCGLDILQPCDDVGSSHGTHTLGTALGRDNQNDFTIGVAPEAKWIAVRNMERGYGSLATYLEGFQWFLAPTDLDGKNPDPSLAPDVINNSWACVELEGCNPDNFYLLRTAIRNLRSAGIVVVASAGNSGRQGCSTVSNPAAIYEESFTVGSVEISDSLSDFSSRGPVSIDSSFRIKPNVTAPGGRVLSSTKGGYAKLSGTSMAGPHVAGLVALLISAAPELRGQVDEIEDLIESTAVMKSEQDTCMHENQRNSFPNSLHGFGRIDALAAVERAIELSTAVEELSKIRPRIFPNPSSSGFEVAFADPVTDAFIILSAMDGKIMAHHKIPDGGQSLKIDNLALIPGIYAVQIWEDQRLVTMQNLVITK